MLLRQARSVLQSYAEPAEKEHVELDYASISTAEE